MKYLTVAHEFNDESVDIAVDEGISGEHVTRVLDRAAFFCGDQMVLRAQTCWHSPCIESCVQDGMLQLGACFLFA